MGGGDAQRAVEREPGHELRVHVVRTVAPDLPDAGVRFCPPMGDLVGEAAHGPPRLGVEVVPGVDQAPRGVDDPSIAVELVLIGGTVAEPNRLAAGVARPADRSTLDWRVAPVQGEEDREPRAVEATGVQQPRQEPAGLGHLPDREERADADAGVTGPREPVVPVADAARVLGQR